MTGADLPRVRFANADFEERDGCPVVVDGDLPGERKDRGCDYPAGPVASPGPGTSRIRFLGQAAAHAIPPPGQ